MARLWFGAIPILVVGCAEGVQLDDSARVGVDSAGQGGQSSDGDGVGEDSPETAGTGAGGSAPFGPDGPDETPALAEGGSGGAVGTRDAGVGGAAGVLDPGVTPGDAGVGEGGGAGTAAGGSAGAGGSPEEPFPPDDSNGGACPAATSGALNRTGWSASAPRWAVYTDYGLDLRPALAIDGNSASRYASGSADFSRAAVNNGGSQQSCTNTSETGCSGNGGGDQDYLALDLGSEQELQQIVFDASGAPADAAKGFRVLLSRDDEVYWQVAAGTGDVVTSYCFDEPQTARYLRIELTESLGTLWWSVYEVNLY